MTSTLERKSFSKTNPSETIFAADPRTVTGTSSWAAVAAIGKVPTRLYSVSSTMQSIPTTTRSHLEGEAVGAIRDQRRLDAVHPGEGSGRLATDVAGRASVT